jgi:adenylate cyclase
LWRAFAGMPTLHPQWGGYGYTWWRHLNAIQPAQFERGDAYEQEVLNSPFGHLIRQAEASAGDRDPWLYLRRRLVGPEAQLDFSDLKAHATAGANDYFAEIVSLVPRETPRTERESAIPLRPIGRRASTRMT